MGCTTEMERDVRLISNNPAIVRCWRDVKQLAGAKLDHSTTFESRGRDASQHQPDVFDGAVRLTERSPDVLGPSPAGLISRAPNREAADPYELEAALDHLPHFIGRFETLQHDFYVRCGHMPSLLAQIGERISII